MPKVKTKELEGDALDWAVTVAMTPIMGYKAWVQADINKGIVPAGCHYSSDWLIAGPIIEAEMIDLVYRPGDKKPGFWDSYGPRTPHGFSADTPLVAAMRCFVASKLGDEIEIPEELL